MRVKRKINLIHVQIAHIDFESRVSTEETVEDYSISGILSRVRTKNLARRFGQVPCAQVFFITALI